MTGELPANDTPTCGLSSVCGHVSCVQQNDPGSALASAIRTCRPAFCRYAAAGRPPDSPPPTTITSTAKGMSRGSPACCASAGRASRGVVVVADSSTIVSSSALRSIPPATARDGIDPRDTPYDPPAG